MTLRRRLVALEGRHSERGGDLSPVVVTLPLLGPDDPIGPPGEYRHTCPNGREYVLRAVPVFADGGAPCEHE